MFNRYLATAVLCCSVSLVHANDQMHHGLKFTSTPGQLTLSTLTCSDPYQATYTLTNITHKTIAFTNMSIRWNTDEDDLGGGVASITETGNNDCDEWGSLEAGASCNITLSISSCYAGNLNRDLVVEGISHGHIHLKRFAKAGIDGVINEVEMGSD